MAKAKDLAGIAALGALGYMLSKGKGDSNKTDTGDETDRLKARKPADQSAGEKAVSDTKSSVLTALQKPSNIREEGIAAANDVRTEASEMNPKPVRRTKPAADNATASKYPSGVMAGARPTPSTTSSSAEGMKNYKSRRNSTSANAVSSSAEGMKNYKPRVTPSAAPFKGGQPGYDEAGNFVGGQRGFDEAGNPMKKGGIVKKMASGGMTASRRADGIASRGKTRCKMY